MLLPLLFILLFIGVSLPLVALPLQRQRQSELPPEDTTHAPSSGYEATLFALRDLEFDHQLGVVANEDYARLRPQLMAQAASALERAQQVEDEEVTARIEAAVLERRTGRARREQPQQRRATTTRYCPQCGCAVDDADHFCTSCGASLS